ncbi:MAG: signal peptidase I [Actinomycetota bacterium]
MIALLLSLVLAVGWLVALRPLALGGSAAYVVVSGRSMEPTYRTGDLVIVRAAPAYDIGDIVAFRVPDESTGRRPVVIHRIVAGDASGYVLQGDNKKERDLWRPRPEDVLGRAWLTLPRGGFILAAARSPLVLAVLAGLFAFLATVAPSADDRNRNRSPRGRWPTARKRLRLGPATSAAGP